MAAATTLVAAGVVSVGVLSATGATDTAPPAGFDSLRANARQVTLDATQRRAFGALPAEFKLDLTHGYYLQAPESRAKASTQGPADSDAQWLVVTGDEGVCVAFSSASRMCAPDEAFANGGARMSTLERLDGHGAASVQGIAPDGFVKAEAIDASGAVLGDTEIVGNAYELSLEDAPRFEVVLVRTDGTRVRTS